jgi:hypothetical protein
LEIPNLVRELFGWRIDKDISFTRRERNGINFSFWDAEKGFHVLASVEVNQRVPLLDLGFPTVSDEERLRTRER